MGIPFKNLVAQLEFPVLDECNIPEERSFALTPFPTCSSIGKAGIELVRFPNPLATCYLLLATSGLGILTSIEPTGTNAL